MPRDGRRVRGSADERTRAHELLRAELLGAANALAAECGGYDGVTMRAVADRVGYRAPIVYQYFAGKHDLLLGAVQQGFTDLAERLGEARCPDERDRHGGLLASTVAHYWEFALSRPHLYRLMHGLADVPFGTAETPPGARACFALIKEAVAAAPGHPAAGDDADAPADLVWAQLHGLVTLTLDGRIKGGPVRARELLGHIARTG